MNLTGRQLINGTDSSEGNHTFQAVNPSDGTALPIKFYSATTSEVDQACQAASEAFAAMQKLPFERRAAFLEAIADEIMALGDALGDRYCAESGLPRPRFEGERGRTCAQLRMFASVVRDGSFLEPRIDHADPDRAPMPKPDVRTMMQPLGPAVVFGASNFPLAFSTAGGDTASALAAGCPVIVKAHPAHPGTAELVGRAVLAAAKLTSMPDGVFALLHDDGYEMAQQLVQNCAVKAVGFTGSFRGGRALFDICAARDEPIPVYAEMGSVNPVFVLPGALKERSEAIANGLAGSVLMGTGQFCTCPGMVFGSGSEFGQFCNTVKQGLSGKDAGVMLHQGIKKSFEAGIEMLKEAGAIPSSTEQPDHLTQASGVVFEVPGDRYLQGEAFQEEVFGPSTLLIDCSSRDQMLEAAEGLGGHLTATIHGTEQDLADNSDLVDLLVQKAGRVIFNGFPTGVEVCHAMVHGGPYPATTDSRTTSVGTMAINRFVRPVCYQDFPDAALPEPLKEANPLNLLRLVDGVRRRTP
jgi:NADP-dependent aldehyde dehydrogenase